MLVCAELKCFPGSLSGIFPIEIRADYSGQLAHALKRIQRMEIAV